MNMSGRWAFVIVTSCSAILPAIVFALVELVFGILEQNYSAYSLSVSEVMLLISLYFSVGVSTFTVWTLTLGRRDWGTSLVGGVLGQFVGGLAIVGTYVAALMSCYSLSDPPRHYLWLLIMFAIFLLWEFAIARIVREEEESEDRGDKLKEICEMMVYVDMPTILSFSLFGLFIFFVGEYSHDEMHSLIVGASSLHLFYSTIVFLVVNSDLLFKVDSRQYILRLLDEDFE